MILLDSDVIIDFLRGRPGTAEFVEGAVGRGEELATAPLDVGEMLRGERSAAARARGLEFLGALTELPIRAESRSGTRT